jgi:hypothetical protein
MVCAAESASSRHPPAWGKEFFWRIRCMLEKSKPLTFNTTRKESVALKSLKGNKEIRIVQAERENCTVGLDESTCKKISSLLESGSYEILRKDPTSQIERKIREVLV